MLGLGKRFLLSIGMLSAMAALAGPALAGGDDELARQGIVKEKPAEGPFVKIDHGYMVPFALTIPGTDVTIDMVPIPGGTAKVGSPDDEKGRTKDEGPQFEIEVEPIWMGKCEISWKQYKPFMNLYDAFKAFETAGIRKVNDDNKIDAITAPTKLYEPDHTFEFGQRPEQAAVTMTQYAAKHYTKWLSLQTDHWYRLPTEAEWEYAARGGTQTAYSFGDDTAKLDDYAWHEGNVGKDYGQRDIGTKQPNPFGLHDMHGNVWEWTLDGYTADGYQKQAGKKLTIWEAVSWPTKAYPRTMRGGSWEFGPERSRAAARIGSNDSEEEDVGWKSYDPNLPLSPWWYTSDPARGVGFRLVRQLEPLKGELREKVWEIDHDDIKYDVDDRLLEGRGALGVVDKTLADAIKDLDN